MVADLPTLNLYVSFDSKPTEAAVWTDITAYLLADPTFSIRRGRQSELDMCQPGTMTFYLDNTTRLFDPQHATGTYYGKLLPYKRVYLTATYNSVVYPVFTGYVQQWVQTYPDYGANMIVPVPCVDGLGILARKYLTASYPEELSGARVSRVLDAVNWTVGGSWVMGSLLNGQLGVTTALGPVADRALSDGDTTIQASTLAGENALSHLQNVEATENGRLFAFRTGIIVFYSRHRSISPPYMRGVEVFGDDPSERQYSDLILEEDLKLYTEVTVTRSGGTAQTASDATAQGNYFVATLGRSTLHTTDAEALNCAQWLLSRYKDPAVRVRQLVIKPQFDPDNLWPAVLNRDLGDRITVIRRPPVGSPIQADYLIEGISHDLASEQWTTTFDLAPADPATYWLMGTSELGATTGMMTRLAY